MIRIFLADDHHLVRQGVRLLLEAEAGLEVVGEAGDGPEAVAGTLSLCPDILIVDMVLPILNGIEVIREVKHRLPDLKVIVLSMYEVEAYVTEALRAGASAYVLKKSTADELVGTIHQVLAGNLYLSPPLDENRLQAYNRRVVESQPGDGYETLTKRERQVLGMAAAGLSNPEIAGRLALSVRTVEMHRGNMLRKLKLKNQTELVLFALQRGLVE